MREREREREGARIELFNLSRGPKRKMFTRLNLVLAQGVYITVPNTCFSSPPLPIFVQATKVTLGSMPSIQYAVSSFISSLMAVRPSDVSAAYPSSQFRTKYLGINLLPKRKEKVVSVSVFKKNRKSKILKQKKKEHTKDLSVSSPQLHLSASAQFQSSPSQLLNIPC